MKPMTATATATSAFPVISVADDQGESALLESSMKYTQSSEQSFESSVYIESRAVAVLSPLQDNSEKSLNVVSLPVGNDQLLREDAQKTSHFFYKKDDSRQLDDLTPTERLVRENLELLMVSKIPASWGDGDVNAHCSDNIVDRDGVPYRSYRDILRIKFRMFGIVDTTWVANLATKLQALGVKSCLEIGGGQGWLSLALSKHFEVTCTDVEPEERSCLELVSADFPVHKMDAVSAVEHYGSKHDAVVVSWPRYSDDWIDQCESGKIIVYIGECPYDGTMAGIKFFKHFKMTQWLQIPARYLSTICVIGTKTDVDSGQFNLDDLCTKASVKEQLDLPASWE